MCNKKFFLKKITFRQYIDRTEVRDIFMLAEIYFCKTHSVYNLDKHLHAEYPLPGVSLFLRLKYL